jgi:hypothetical protein
VFDAIFRFFFKYEPLVFEQGDFVYWASRSMWLVAVVAAGCAVYVLWTYRQVAVLQGRDRYVLIGTRAALLAVALFAVLRPTLLLKVAVPQQNYVGILYDDSRSMQIADQDGGPRSEFVERELGRPDSELLTALGQQFALRTFRFSSSAERLTPSAGLTFSGTATRIGAALDHARDELTGLPVAGLIVVSDGADNAEVPLDESIAGLTAQGIPVFTVGVGKTRLSRDVQVTRVQTPRRALQGTSLVIDVVITQTGYRGLDVPLIVEAGGLLLNQQQITLPGDGEATTVRARFKLPDVGPQAIRFRIPVQNGEEVTQNNQRDALIDVYSRREKILFVEGEPRPEPKFVRQATDRDDNLQVVLLQRTAEATASTPDKYLRLGVDAPEELQGGFPVTPEELFEYSGLILGSIEASAFSQEQLRLFEDFVDIRGGGLLVLGGRSALAEGGWAGTALANALPVLLGRANSKPLDPPLELTVRPTRSGQAHPATQIADTEAAAAAKWKELPPLTAVNAVPIEDLKPGATALLSGTDSRGREQVVLAMQRYGRGKALVMPVQDSWLWRMHASMAVEDPTHRNFWQRLARWVVDSVPDRVMVTASPDRVQRGEPVSVMADVVDRAYRGINDGQITASVTAPSGRIEDVPMEWALEHDGEYHARFTPAEEGLYRVTVSGSSRSGADVARGTAYVRVAPSDAEYFDAAMQETLLRRLAEETSGRFFPASNTATLVNAITYSGRGVTVVEERELWDMPIVLFLLLGLMGGEWLYRRSRGLA